MNYSFRKKPVVIEAFQMTKARRQNNKDWPSWLHQAWNEERGKAGALYPREAGTGFGLLMIGTLESEAQLVSWDDWIIRGVKGEIYPCKPDIFEATYEPVSPAEGKPECPECGGDRWIKSGHGGTSQIPCPICQGSGHSESKI